MTLAVVRDIVIIVSGVVVTAALIFLSVIAYLLYRRMLEIMKPLEAVSVALQTLVTGISRLVSEPLNRVASFVDGVRDGLQKVLKIFQRGG
ncbi:MAG: hypothetical protein HYX84_08185 [Chloroflexi bacterium]|nr:hypothetical protein [Chloroflexota bacterium]